MRDLTRRMITTAAVILGAGSLALFLTGSARVWTSAGFAAALVLLLILTNTLDVYMARRARRDGDHEDGTPRFVKVQEGEK